MKTRMRKSIWIVAAALGTLLCAQDSGNRVTVPFRDASKPRKLIVHLMNGSITVKGYDGKDAIVEFSGGSHRTSRRSSSPPAPGMRRLDQGDDFDVTEDNNTIRVGAGMMGGGSVVIQVPVETSLNLDTMNGGHIEVENISGEIEAQSQNASLTITNVSGSVVANTMNGKINVSLNKVTANKSMSFSTMNGNMEIQLPADVKANVKMRSDNGEIWTDFDVKLGATSKTTVTDNRPSGGRYRVRVDKTIEGTINGGGPEMRFSTMNGRITIGKK
jgi:hypothetical protein